MHHLSFYSSPLIIEKYTYFSNLKFLKFTLRNNLNHCFQQADLHLKWLLDPLPVDARVIVSASENTCPQAWRSWPTVSLGCLGTKNVRELLRAELATLDAWLDGESESRILTHCRTVSTSCPLYVMLLARHLAR